MGRNQQSRHKIVIAGGRDAWKVAALLAKRNVPVIYGSIYDLPTSEAESYDVHYKAPEILRQARRQGDF